MNNNYTNSPNTKLKKPNASDSDICENKSSSFVDNGNNYPDAFLKDDNAADDSLHQITNNESKGNGLISCPRCHTGQVVLTHNYYFCDDETCIFIEDIKSFNTNIHSYNKLKCSEKDLDLLSTVDSCYIDPPKENMQNFIHTENINKESKNGDQFSSIEIINLDAELVELSMGNNSIDMVQTLEKSIGKTTNRKKYAAINIFSKGIVTDNKVNLITSQLNEQLNAILWQSSNKLFNWTTLKCTLKAHSRILYTLLIHMDDFITDTSDEILNIKKEYSFCDSFANNFNKESAKLMSFNFITKLFSMIDFIPHSDLSDKDMDERLLLSFRKYFAKFDHKRSFAFEYKVETSCPICFETSSDISSDYFLSLERNKYSFKLTKNKLAYAIKCPVCRGQCKKTVEFLKVPKFIMFHCHKGIRENLSRYNAGFMSESNERLSLVGVVECTDKTPYIDCIERRINFFDYGNLQTGPVVLQNFTVHVRNSDGWFSLNNKKPLMCEPKKSLQIDDDKNIRLLIFGTVTDAAKYKGSINLQEYTEKHHEERRAEFKDIFSKTEDEALYKDVIKEKKKPKKTGPRKKRLITDFTMTDEDRAAIEAVPWSESDLFVDSGPRKRTRLSVEVQPEPPVSSRAMMCSSGDDDDEWITAMTGTTTATKTTMRSRDSGICDLSVVSSSGPSVPSTSSGPSFDDHCWSTLDGQPGHTSTAVTGHNDIDHLLGIVRSKVNPIVGQ